MAYATSHRDEEMKSFREELSRIFASVRRSPKLPKRVEFPPGTIPVLVDMHDNDFADILELFAEAMTRSRRGPGGITKSWVVRRWNELVPSLYTLLSEAEDDSMKLPRSILEGHDSFHISARDVLIGNEIQPGHLQPGNGESVLFLLRDDGLWRRRPKSPYPIQII